MAQPLSPPSAQTAFACRCEGCQPSLTAGDSHLAPPAHLPTQVGQNIPDRAGGRRAHVPGLPGLQKGGLGVLLPWSACWCQARAERAGDQDSKDSDEQ